MNRFLRPISFFLLIALLFTGCSKTNNQESVNSSNQLTGNGLVVLCYHRIISGKILNWGRSLNPQESELAYYTIGTDEFSSQLTYLKQNNVRFVTPQEAQDYLTGKQSFPGKLALVTLDDGDLSIYKNAYPLLQKMKIPFLLFLIAGQTGLKWEGFNMCSWDQIKKMQNSGFCTVGLHTYNLHYLDSQTKQPVFLSADKKNAFDDDTKKGIACLKKHLGTDAAFFAYPYGFGTPATDQILMSRGISNIFTLSAKINRPGDKRFYIGRFLVTSENWKQIASWVRTK